MIPAIPLASCTVIQASSVDWLASGSDLTNGGAVIAPVGLIQGQLGETVDNPLFVQRQTYT